MKKKIIGIYISILLVIAAAPWSMLSLSAETSALKSHIAFSLPVVTTNDPAGLEETNATLHGILIDDGGERCDLGFEYGLNTTHRNWYALPDCFTKQTNPTTLPTSTGLGVAFSHDSTYLAVAHFNSPYLTIYKMGESNETYYKIANPATLPPGDAYGVAFSHNDTYLAVAHAISPYVTIYKRGLTNETYYKIANPATLPTGSGRSVAFSHDSTYLAVAHYNSPYLTIYKMGESNETYYKIANPATLPSGISRGVAFSHDSTYLAVVSYASPYLTIYKRGLNNETYYKIANPATLPTYNAYGVAFSHDSTYLAVAHFSYPYVTIYKMGESNETYYKIANPTILPTGNSIGVAFSHDSAYLAVSHFNYPYLTLYRIGKSNGTYYKIANPSTLPTNDGVNVAFSHNSIYMGVAHFFNPYVTLYKISYTTGDFFSYNLSELNPGTLYYYRAFANNSVGSGTGVDKSFLTKPLSPTSMTATPLNSATISLSWTKGTGANQTRIQRKQGSYPLTINDGTNVYNGTGTTVQDTGLNPGATYYYRAWSFATWTTNPSLSQWSDAYADAIGTTNHLPLISDPIPTPGSTNISLLPQMSITVTDPDNDLMTIRWYSNSSGAWQQFGTNASVPNGTYHQINTNFSAYTTTYWWNVTVTDQMDTTTSALYSFTTQKEPQQNTSPLPPEIIGPLAAGPNITLNFTTTTTDPDGDDVYYLWDWGDNTTTDWLGPYASGQPMRTNHSWNHTGEYDIRVKAKDTTGMESNWSEPHHITIAPQLWIRNIQLGFIYIIFLNFNKSFLYSYFLQTLGISVVITRNDLIVEVDATDYVDMVSFEALNLINGETYYGQDTNGSGFFSYSFNITRGIYQLTVKAYDASGNHIDTTGIPLLVYLRFGKYATSRSLHHPLRSARLVH